MSSENPSLLDVLCDDELAHVLSYIDFRSAVRFSRGTSKSVRNRIIGGVNETGKEDLAPFEQAWCDMYRRHHFSPVELCQKDKIDYVAECRARKRLFNNLMGRSQKQVRGCFNIPNRYFYFLPLSPEDDDEMDDDSPPVDFHCPSFVLTSTGLGGELVLLNPFDGSVSVYGDIVNNAVKSDEAMMEHAMLDAASVIIDHRSNAGPEESVRDEHIIAGAVIDESVYRNHNMEKYRSPPSQVILDKWRQDYIDERMLKHFNNHILGRGRADNMVVDPDDGDEIVIDYFGIEAKRIMDGHKVKGTHIVVGRSFSNDAETVEDERVCTEIMVWRRMVDDGTRCSLYRERLVCRLGWSFHCMDTCAKYNRLYVAFHPHDGPYPRESNEDAGNLAESSYPRFGQRTIFAYPLLHFVDGKDAGTDFNNYFSAPEFCLTCRHSVSIFVVDPTGRTLIVGTANGTIEVWEPSEQSSGRLLSTLDLGAEVVLSAKRFHAQEKHGLHTISLRRESPATAGTKTESVVCDSNSPFPEVSTTEHENPNGLANVNLSSQHCVTEPSVPRLNPSRIVEAIHLPMHCEVSQCGFVSVQHDRSEGTTLLLWKHAPNSDGRQMNFQVVSLINLPLSPQREPQIHYDGRRLIVFGQDHIGMIVLVYHVLSTWEDMDCFERHMGKKHGASRGDDSAGLYNFTYPPRVAFANRIRHAGLGGLEYYDSVYMTCNERFIVVNTKTGNLVGGDSGADEGLLIIDLEDH